MSAKRSPILRMRARGPLACFTRPELKVERVSYPVMTPSAARGMLEAVLWKPAIAWRIRRILVLKPIRFSSIRRNEVSTKATAPSMAVVNNGGPIGHYCSDDDRAQRNAVLLCDVDYVVEADLALTPRAGDEDNLTKFVDMFQRRVAKGQHFSQPYFGCREFAARIEPAGGAPPPIADCRDLGMMLWDINFSERSKRPVFFAARLVDGVMVVPNAPDGSIELATNGGAP